MLIFDAVCGPACHSGAAPSKGLSLEAGVSQDQLVNMPSAEDPTLLRVRPFVAADSYLMVKIVASDSRRVGSRMPRNGPPYLSDAQVGAIEDWINAGATPEWQKGDEVNDTADTGDSGDSGDTDDTVGTMED